MQWRWTSEPHYSPVTPTSFHNCLLLYGHQCNEGEPVSHTTPPLHLQAFITVSYYMYQCNEGEPVSHTTPPLHLQAFITVSYYMYQCNEGEPVSHTTPPLHLQAFITVSSMQWRWGRCEVITLITWWHLYNIKLPVSDIHVISPLCVTCTGTISFGSMPLYFVALTLLCSKSIVQ